MGMFFAGRGDRGCGGGPHAFVEVGFFQVALVEPGEIAEVLDDASDALQAVARAVDEPRQVLQRVGQVDAVDQFVDGGEQFGVIGPGSAAGVADGLLVMARSR